MRLLTIFSLYARSVGATGSLVTLFSSRILDQEHVEADITADSHDAATFLVREHSRVPTLTARRHSREAPRTNPCSSMSCIIS